MVASCEADPEIWGVTVTGLLEIFSPVFKTSAVEELELGLEVCGSSVVSSLQP